MRVRVVYFAGTRDAGCADEWLELPDSAGTLGALRDLLRARGEPWASTARRGTRFAVNRTVVAGADAPIRDGDEVAVFPAISGG